MLPLITAIILAAGKSTRLGRPKQLLPFAKHSLIRVVTETILNTQVDKIIVVLGYEIDKISKELKDLPINIINNPHFDLGQSSSMIAGIKAADLESSLMFVLGDQPLIKPETINLLLRKHIQENKIVIPSYMGTNGHPVIFPNKFYPKLLSLTGDIGAKNIIASHQCETLVINVKDRGIIQDIDTWNDYQLLKKEV